MPFSPFNRPLTPETLAAAEQSAKLFAAAVHAARQEAGPDAIVLAWASDIHLHASGDYPRDLGMYGKFVDSSANLRLALTEIAQIQPDLLVFGGDVADSGCGGEAPTDEYTDFKLLLDEMLPAEAASLLVLGNHDHADKPLSAGYRSALKKIARPDWPDPVEQDDHYYAARRSGWRFITLDTRQGQPPSEKQCNWLAAELAHDAATPTVIFMHRPFVCVGNWVDNHRVMDRRTFDIIDQAACVKAVLSGHTHKAATCQYRKKIHSVFPAVAYGIGDACGWGCIILGKDRVANVFVKDLAGEFFEHVSYTVTQQAGNYRRMPFLLFENSPLCDPCTLPRRNDAASRD
jgi:hypothetical protein